MDFNTTVKLTIYRHFARTGRAPAATEIADILEVDPGAIGQSYADLRASRVLWLEPDGVTIRMAPPFSGVPTQHRVEAGGHSWFANCAWDVLGIPAALHQVAVAHSTCGQSGEPLRLEVGLDGPEASPWVFHCLVPAAHWWDDLVFT
jgi:hypothetical protein